MSRNCVKEKAMEGVFFVTALASIVCVVNICIFLLANGVPAIREIGFGNFLLGKEWFPMEGIFGILPMMVASIYVTAGAILIGGPIGLFTAMYLVMFADKRLYKIIKPGINLMAGIPSIVYGFFGLMVLLPIFNNFGINKSILTASLILAIMILPTVINVIESSLRQVPDSYFKGALALGATKEWSAFKVMMPAAKSGILAGIALGIGRAVGETMAVVMIAGNQPLMTTSIFQGVRTMTANIVLEMGYATGMHQQALIATAVVLFVFILIINLSFAMLKRKVD